MKAKFLGVFFAILVFIFFNFITKFISNLVYIPHRSTCVTNYNPDGCKTTIEIKFNSLVTDVDSSYSGHLIAVDDIKRYYWFNYKTENIPSNWLKEYPKEFIKIGDTIIKTDNCDTFYVIRNNQKQCYLLPKD